MPRVARRGEDRYAMRPRRRERFPDTQASWQALVEQIAELEDLLTEVAPPDPDAHLGRAWLEQLLHAKRRQLRGMDVAP